MAQAKNLDELAQVLFEALVAAETHLSYCGYGDNWERECADASKLPTKIDDAIAQARSAGMKEAE